MRTYTLIRHQGETYAALSILDALDLAQPEPDKGAVMTSCVDAPDAGAARLMDPAHWWPVGPETMKAAGY